MGTEAHPELFSGFGPALLVFFYFRLPQLRHRAALLALIHSLFSDTVPQYGARGEVSASIRRVPRLLKQHRLR